MTTLLPSLRGPSPLSLSLSLHPASLPLASVGGEGGPQSLAPVVTPQPPCSPLPTICSHLGLEALDPPPSPIAPPAINVPGFDILTGIPNAASFMI